MTGFIDPLDIAGDEPAFDADTLSSGTGDDREVLQRVRDLVLQAHREVVPELIAGASLTELLASIEPAREAYASLVTRIEADRVPEPESATVSLVPAGGTGPVPLDLDRMPASEKLRRGILQRTRSTPS
ncbi:MAG: hypothetical protein M3457_11090 [Chloroflexota bacterium]|nr:hypothetical protein [Chloroflexota bacterium]